MNKHTEGPWEVTSLSGDIHAQSRNGQNWICQGPNEDAASAPPAEERRANARILAASLDLLEAAQLSIGSLKWDQSDKASREVMRRLYAAVQKATE